VRPLVVKLLTLAACLLVAVAVWPAEGAEVGAQATRAATATPTSRPTAPALSAAGAPSGRVRLPIVARDPSPTPAPRTQMAVGTNIHDQNFELVQQMGFPWVKLYADWDTPDPNNVIRLVDGARTRYPGVKSLLRIDKSPPGARTGNNDDPLRPEAWQPFLETLGPQLRGKVQAYELFNEPNLKYEWNVNIAGGSGMPSPRGYARILQLGYRAIKEVDPDALVISGGLASAGGGGPEAIGDLEFIRGLYDAGARGYFDGLGSHPYGGPCSYEVSSCGGEGIYFRRAEEQHNAMLAKGDSRSTIWATELGWLVDPRAYGYGSYQGRDCMAGLGGRKDWVRGPQDVATQLTGAYRYASDSWPWMGGMFFFNFDYAAAGWVTGYDRVCGAETWYSIVSKNNLPGRPYTEPAFDSLRAYARDYALARAAAQSTGLDLPPLPPNPAADVRLPPIP